MNVQPTTSPRHFGWRTLRRRTPVALVAALLLLATGSTLAQGGGDAYDDSPENAAYDNDYTDVDAGGYETSYSYVRNLAGSATLIQADGERSQLELNQPVLVGDRVRVSSGSRLELLLSDGNLLRVDGDSEVRFDALAYSPETRHRVTVLRIDEGNVELVVTDGSVGEEFPRLELANATVYVGEAGRYRLTTVGGDWSQVVARRGWAEVVTDRGSEVVQSGREALVEGTRSARIALGQAGGFDALERWGERLDAQLADNRYVDDSLRYAAAPLDDYGSWVSVDSRRAWRPRVAVDWRPYQLGRWQSTPIGLTWVSSEPWGWVPYHYGTWDHVPGHGWVWFPGTRFAPSWTYWYWGRSHVAWVPVGYYTRHYPRYSHGFRFGVHGWAGGGWGLFADWVACPTAFFGHRQQHRFVHDGRFWGRHHGGHGPGRGLITTDTRGIQPRHWRDPDAVLRVLTTRPGAGGGGARGVRTAELPDVTPFVERRAELPRDVERRVVVAEPGVARRVAGTPLAPATAGTDRGRAGLARPRVALPRGEANGVRAGNDGGGEGVRLARPAAPSAGGGAGEGRVRVVRPRTVEPEASPADPGRAVRGRTDAPRAGTSGGDRERPRVVTPRAVPRAAPQPSTPQRQETPRATTPRATPRVATPSTPTPRADTPRATPRADTPQSETPQRATPRRRDGEDDGGQPRVSTPATRSTPSSRPQATSPRAAAPRSPSTSPSSRSPRLATPSRPSTRSAAPQAAPRSDRAGASSAPPARRVVRGSQAGSRPAPRATTPRASSASSSTPRATTPQRSTTPRASAPRPTTPRATNRATPQSSTGNRTATRSGAQRSTASSDRGSKQGNARSARRSKDDG